MAVQKKPTAKKTVKQSAKPAPANQTSARKSSKNDSSGRKPAKKSASAKAPTRIDKKVAEKKSVAKKKSTAAGKKTAARNASAPSKKTTKTDKAGGAAASDRRPSKKAAPAAKRSTTQRSSAKNVTTKKVPNNNVASKQQTAAKPNSTTSTSKATTTGSRAASSTSPTSVELPKPKFSKSGIGYTKDFPLAFVKSAYDSLQEERIRLTGQANRLESEAQKLVEDGEMGDVQFDDEGGEGDTLAVEREQDLTLSAQARETVREIDLALERIAQGTFGYSTMSGLPIPMERLEAIPWSTVLVEEKVGGIGRR